jgi:uncharacterized protein (TIGR01777 family)
MKVFVTGGTGFIGSNVCRWLLDAGHSVVATGTSAEHRRIHHERFDYICADTTDNGDWTLQLQQADAVINLAGRSILGRWSAAYKKQIRDSRILTTRRVVAALPQGKNTVLCSASAVGYYGDRGDTVLGEEEPPGAGFLAEVGKEWESEALRAEEKGARVALLRFGVVLGKGGGAMEKLIPTFRMRAGGPLGDGKQWFSWIHIEDVVGAIGHIIEHPELRGPFNLCAPNPIRNRDLAKTLGDTLRVAAVVRVPAFALRLAMGEAASAFLDSLRAEPNRLLQSGYRFKYVELAPAIRQIAQ